MRVSIIWRMLYAFVLRCKTNGCSSVCERPGIGYAVASTMRFDSIISRRSAFQPGFQDGDVRLLRDDVRRARCRVPVGFHWKCRNAAPYLCSFVGEERPIIIWSRSSRLNQRCRIAKRGWVSSFFPVPKQLCISIKTIKTAFSLLVRSAQSLFSSQPEPSLRARGQSRRSVAPGSILAAPSRIFGPGCQF